MHPKHLSIDDFTYELPEEKIAKYPLAQRDASKLLVYKNSRIEDTSYKNIDKYLPPGSLLILNNTRVIEARILFQKQTGAAIEIFCLDPYIPDIDITTAMQQRQSVIWLCLIGGVSKWKHGQVLQKKITADGYIIVVEAKFVDKVKASFAVQISWTPAELSFAEILHYAGNIPLPPYLKREAESTDEERYQTVYANTKGSVAAPTAGLHFTKELFEKLHLKKIETAWATLHVGAGTFKPVKSVTMEHHDMHAEFVEVDISLVENILKRVNGHITAVGTTSLRTIESLYWMGVKLIHSMNITVHDLIIGQWEPYELPAKNITPSQALEALLDWMTANKISRLITKTQILIAPGYTMRIANALITNFHQPRSTLLLLVAAFVGDDWRKIYDYGLKNDFRFLSYGDGCLLFRH
ncbi:MAG: S-adenosylmethionine:tRNA ribosyltransferase-isomerase [Chitinophagaceae bacterium]|nr:S-adenosylmethionine:tRNA ribosyltransferase-isomerase [Chitinophagaceae bacterium]